MAEEEKPQDARRAADATTEVSASSHAPPPALGPDTDPAPAPPLAAESDPLGYKSMPPEPPRPVGAISSGAFEISRASFVDSLEMGGSIPPADLPPSAVIADAMGRSKKGLSLGAIVGIAVGVLVVATGLSLLLFR